MEAKKEGGSGKVRGKEGRPGSGINEGQSGRRTEMSSLLKWDPVREFEEFGRRMAPWFGRREKGAIREGAGENSIFEWSPSVDVAEEDKAYLVTAELPEVKKEDMKVTVENGVLAISGERKKEKEEKKGVRYHRIERCYGSFLRSFTLPEDADPASVKATMKDGVLKIRIEKRPGTPPKAIPIGTE
jgi:HSP20 family protein